MCAKCDFISDPGLMNRGCMGEEAIQVLCQGWDGIRESSGRARDDYASIISKGSNSLLSADCRAGRVSWCSSGWGSNVTSFTQEMRRSLVWNDCEGIVATCQYLLENGGPKMMLWVWPGPSLPIHCYNNNIIIIPAVAATPLWLDNMHLTCTCSGL